MATSCCTLGIRRCFIAAERPALPLFDWLSAVRAVDAIGEVKVSQTSYDYTRRLGRAGATVVAATLDMTVG